MASDDIPALVTPSVLVWARERANMTLRYVADALGDTYPYELNSWERGVTRPTIRQAERLAELYEVPFGAFYLAKPPVGWLSFDANRENQRMCAAVWRWLHPGQELPEAEGGHTPDYVEDEDAAAQLRHDMLGHWPYATLQFDSVTWEAKFHGDEPHNPDGIGRDERLNRAVLLAASERAKKETDGD